MFAKRILDIFYITAKNTKKVVESLNKNGGTH
jgi:hypothetical protein